MQMVCTCKHYKGVIMQREYRTKSRDDIMAYVEQNKEKRFSASDVYAHLREKGNKVNLTTVYRNLEKMTEAGQLLRLGYAKDGSALYQYLLPNSSCYEHLHIQCSNCGKVFHLDDEFMSLIEEYFQKHDFSLIAQESVLIGICSECRY